MTVYKAQSSTTNKVSQAHHINEGREEKVGQFCIEASRWLCPAQHSGEKLEKAQSFVGIKDGEEVSGFPGL